MGRKPKSNSDNLNYSIRFSSKDERKLFFDHAKKNHKPLSQLIRDLIRFDIAGVSPYYKQNDSDDIRELLQKKIDLLEKNIAEIIKMKLNEFLLFQQTKEIEYDVDLETLILSKLDSPKSIIELRDLLKIEYDVLLLILKRLEEKGDVKKDWGQMTYKRSKN